MTCRCGQPATHVPVKRMGTSWTFPERALNELAGWCERCATDYSDERNRAAMDRLSSRVEK